MVDGTIINTGGGAGIMGMTGGYVADVANAQEVNVQISGALGESETGGASINIIPRTGGNPLRRQLLHDLHAGRRMARMASCAAGTSSRVRGSPRTTASFPRSTTAIRSSATTTRRGRSADRSSATACGSSPWRAPGRRTRGAARPTASGTTRTPASGAQNYQADRSQQPLQLMNMTRNANVRLTLQATQKNKINFFWDEGLTCQDPCDGSVAPWTSRDGWWSGQVHPARLMQASWTNPLTNVILLEAGLSANRQLYDFSQHRYYKPQSGHSAGDRIRNDRRRGCDRRAQINAISAIFGMPSGPWSDGIGGLAESRNLNDWRPRASISYVTGPHSAKFGYDGGYFAQTRRNSTGNTRLEYRYDTPAATLLQRRESCGVDLRQHEPLLPERPVQPGAAARALASQYQYRDVHHRQPGRLHRPLRAGSVDAEAASR